MEEKKKRIKITCSQIRWDSLGSKKRTRQRWRQMKGKPETADLRFIHSVKGRWPTDVCHGPIPPPNIYIYIYIYIYIPFPIFLWEKSLNLESVVNKKLKKSYKMKNRVENLNFVSDWMTYWTSTVIVMCCNCQSVIRMIISRLKMRVLRWWNFQKKGSTKKRKFSEKRRLYIN